MITDPREALSEAHAVYPEIWVPMDKNNEREQRIHDLSRYQVNPALMSLARPDAVFLHCLPAFRGQEVTPDVLDGPQSVVWQQAGNRLYTAQALMHTLVASSG